MYLQSIALRDISIPEGRKQRYPVDELATSIDELGLIDLITLTADLRLACGYPRFLAMQQKGGASYGN